MIEPYGKKSFVFCFRIEGEEIEIMDEKSSSAAADSIKKSSKDDDGVVCIE